MVLRSVAKFAFDSSAWLSNNPQNETVGSGLNRVLELSHLFANLGIDIGRKHDLVRFGADQRWLVCWPNAQHIEIAHKNIEAIK